MVDKNKQWASIILPADPTVEMSDAMALELLFRGVQVPRASEIAVQEYVINTPSPGGGLTPLVYDMAVLVFESAAGTGLRVPILGPGNIFLPDDITIDTTIANVDALIEGCLDLLRNKLGEELVVCMGGRRCGAGGP